MLWWANAAGDQYYAQENTAITSLGQMTSYRLAAAATTNGVHAHVAVATATGEILQQPTGTVSATDLPLAPFSPPLTPSAVLDLTVAAAGGQLVLAYTDGAAITEELVVVDGNTTALIRAPLTVATVATRPTPAVTIRAIAYARGPAGLGRYAWLEDDGVVRSLRSVVFAR